MIPLGRARVMTYNVHSCRGSDRRLDPQRIVQVIQALAPDVVALQELDVGQQRSRSVDQASLVAEGVGMRVHFTSARDCDGGFYGNAVLSRLPSRLQQGALLPRLGHESEARVAQWVVVDFPWGPLDVLNTHLALRRRERWIQTQSLLGERWLASPLLGDHAVFCGDLNAVPRSSVYEAFRGRMKDAQLLASGGRPQRTFPALLPFIRIDHVFISDALGVERVHVPGDRLSRLASDHRPLVVDLVCQGPRS